MQLFCPYSLAVSLLVEQTQIVALLFIVVLFFLILLILGIRRSYILQKENDKVNASSKTNSTSKDPTL
jgi:hypothetical protein